MNFGDIIDRALSVGTGILGKWKLWGAIAALWALSIVLARCDAYDDGRDAERAAQAVAVAKAQAEAREADAQAGKAVDAVKAGVEAENQKARDAAAVSDDPLRDGLGAL